MKARADFSRVAQSCTSSNSFSSRSVMNMRARQLTNASRRLHEPAIKRPEYAPASVASTMWSAPLPEKPFLTRRRPRRMSGRTLSTTTMMSVR
eukprot:6175312-Prymnesium_polylepis.1